MRLLYDSTRFWIAILAVVTVGLTLSARAADDAAAWQGAISSQIQAFRDGDAPTAFHYAGKAFKISFQNAEVFFEAIVRSGYGPIVESRSHSFGDYRDMGELGVLQQVHFVGGDQHLYEAFYQVREEAEGWRVQGVQLFRQDGMAI